MLDAYSVSITDVFLYAVPVVLVAFVLASVTTAAALGASVWLVLRHLGSGVAQDVTTLDALPLDLTRSFSDLRELDAVLGCVYGDLMPKLTRQRTSSRSPYDCRISPRLSRIESQRRPTA